MIAVGHPATSGAEIDYDVRTLAVLELPNLPEGIATDRDGRIVVSMILTGEIRQMDQNASPSALAFTSPAPAGLDVGDDGVVYVTVASNFPPGTEPNPDTHGVWQIQTDGTVERFAELPIPSTPNDVVIDARFGLFVSDSSFGTIYRVSSSGDVEAWITHPLLLGAADVPPPWVPIGANGLAIVGSDLYVNNTTLGIIVRIAVKPDGSAGTPEVAFQDPRLWGADGLGADRQGNLYVANIAQNTVVRVAADGTIKTLADANDGLDGPSSLVILDGDITELVFVNSGLFTMQSGGRPNPSVMSILLAPASPPVLHNVMHGIGAEFAGGSSDTFISPLGSWASGGTSHCAFTQFDIMVTEPVELISHDGLFTGALEDKPNVAGMIDRGGGHHIVLLDRALAPGEWFGITLNVQSTSTGCPGTLVLWVAHHPGDIDQDGVTSIRDGTSFGAEWHDGRRSQLIDLNCDGVVDIRDSTAFGDLWNGIGEATQAWKNHVLPPKPN